MQKPIRLGGAQVDPGQRATVNLPVARLYNHSEIDLLVHVVHGRRPGPCLFVSAAIHGDEICGIEIIRRLLARKNLGRLKGTLLAIPVVNVFGFVNQSRYLPDRRDLNRSFPGSGGGSLASRLAQTFMREVVTSSTHGIDLHTGSNHRGNLPQIRAAMEDPETARLARAFGAPVIINSNMRDGSLRQEGVDRGIPILVYEGGEALRYSEEAIRFGLKGVNAVMRAIGMLPPRRNTTTSSRSLVAEASTWVRAPISGVHHGAIRLGANVEEGETLGVISDPFGEGATAVKSPVHGIVIGRLNLPLVHQGDALFHLACLDERLPEGMLLEQELLPEDWRGS